MQKALTSLAACGEPSARHPAAGSPVTVIVVARPLPNAPSSFCSQRVNSPVVHCALAVQAWGGFSNAFGAIRLRQKPQNTDVWVAVGAAVLLADPVVSANGIGRKPMLFPAGGGQ